MMNRVIGYKAFDNMKDRYGNEYATDIIYEIPGMVNLRKEGFHFCEHISDVFRYYNGFDDNTVVCKVVGMGELDKYDDEYNEYFDMYESSKLRILKELSREEILEAACNDGIFSVLRLISSYKLTEEEINTILSRYNDNAIKDYIDYYQRNDEQAFIRRIKK